jgi:hypothetical protein
MVLLVLLMILRSFQSCRKLQMSPVTAQHLAPRKCAGWHLRVGRARFPFACFPVLPRCSWLGSVCLSSGPQAFWRSNDFLKALLYASALGLCTSHVGEVRNHWQWSSMMIMMIMPCFMKFWHCIQVLQYGIYTGMHKTKEALYEHNCKEF